jgi:hypothetical protein
MAYRIQHFIHQFAGTGKVEGIIDVLQMFIDGAEKLCG